MAARHGGRVSAMPVVSYLVASENPPMVGVACAPKGFTCRLALKAGSFSLSVLDRSRRDAVSRLATTSGAEVEDKLSEVGLKYEAGKRVNAPVLRDALATLECTLKSSKRAGDHLLLLGSVESASASDAFTDRWDYARYRPILYTGWTEGLTLFPGS